MPLFHPLALLVAALLVTAPLQAGATECPQGVLFFPSDGSSSAETGFTGIGHGRPIFGHTLALAVSCGATTPPCGTCTIIGILPDAGGANLRCASDTAIACTVATELTDCGLAGDCRLFLGPPQPISGGGASACQTTELASAVTGTVDVESGAIDVSFAFVTTVQTGVEQRGCVSCAEDPVPNDGARDGYCQGGPHTGHGCDVGGTPPAPYEDFATSSFDCPSWGSTIAQLHSGVVTYSTTAQSRTVTAASPSCRQTGATSLQCLCDTCNNAAAEPCASDADCPPSGGNPGVCGGRRCVTGPNDGTPCVNGSECPGGTCTRPGEATAPNGCLDDTATPGSEAYVCVDSAPAGDGVGECLYGPVDLRCTNHPNRGCTDDGDCDDVPGACEDHLRRCFADNGVTGGGVQVTGAATPPVAHVAEPTALGMLACLPPSRTGAFDAAVGLPGLTRQQHLGRLELVEEYVTRTVVGTYSSITTIGAGPTSDFDTTITSPVGGLLRILTSFDVGAPPDPAQLMLARRIEATGSPSPPQAPLRITVAIAPSAVPALQNAATIDVYADGAGPIPHCSAPNSAVDFDPCVTSRADTVGGGIELLIVSTTGGSFTFGYDPGPPICPPTPDACRTALNSTVSLIDRTPDTKDQLAWKWTRGAATTVTDLGDPVTTDDYALCLYHAYGLRTRMRIPAGGTCGTKPCWKSVPKGFMYANKSGTPHGVTKLKIRAGDAGKAQVQVGGKGDFLPMPPPFSITYPLIVQLRNLGNGVCWGTTFDAPFSAYEATRLKDKAN